MVAAQNLYWSYGLTIIITEHLEPRYDIFCRGDHNHTYKFCVKHCNVKLQREEWHETSESLLVHIHTDGIFTSENDVQKWSPRL
jgi:hypothetical protein